MEQPTFIEKDAIAHMKHINKAGDICIRSEKESVICDFRIHNSWDSSSFRALFRLYSRLDDCDRQT